MKVPTPHPSFVLGTRRHDTHCSTTNPVSFQVELPSGIIRGMETQGLDMPRTLEGLAHV